MALDSLPASETFFSLPCRFYSSIKCNDDTSWSVVSIKSDNGLHFVHLSAQELISLSVFHTQHIRLLGVRSLLPTMHTALPPAAPQKETLPNFSPPRLTSPHWSWSNIYPCYAGAAWINASVKGSPGPNIFQQRTSHWFASLPCLPRLCLVSTYGIVLASPVGARTSRVPAKRG